MSNDPLLGLDAPVPVVEESKWREVPKKRSGGYAEPTRYRELRVEGAGARIKNVEVEGDIVAVSKPAPVAPEIQDYLHDNLGMSPPVPAKAYVVEKPSLFQRFLDWLLL